MKLIACVAKNNGLTFLGKRLSKDSILLEKILDLSKGHRLLMNSYSANLFKDFSNITVDEDFLSIAEDDDFCFIENVNAQPEKISELYIFNWNRDYPSDFFFSFNPELSGFKLIGTQKFKGSSHEKITLNTYTKL